MAVSPTFRVFVLDQLGRTTTDLRSRAMFGGVGIYSGELFFALLADDTLYFKVDDTNRGDFVAAGMGPFRPFGEDGEVMQYYQVPSDLLEGGEELGPWVEKAIEVARRARRSKQSRGKKKPG